MPRPSSCSAGATPKTSRSTTSASAAGASRALVYHYFGGKQELYVAALKSAAGQLESRNCARTGGGRPRSTSWRRGSATTSTSSRSTRRGSPRCCAAAPPTAAAGGRRDRRRVRQRLFRLIRQADAGRGRARCSRITLRSWIASSRPRASTGWSTATSSGPRWRSMLLDHMVALLGVAARHDPQVDRAASTNLVRGQAKLVRGL